MIEDRPVPEIDDGNLLILTRVRESNRVKEFILSLEHEASLRSFFSPQQDFSYHMSHMLNSRILIFR